MTWARCYAREPVWDNEHNLPDPWLFLAGPTPRDMDTRIKG